MMERRIRSLTSMVFVFFVFYGCKNRGQLSTEKSAKIHPILASLRTGCAGASCHGSVSKTIISRWQQETRVVSDCLSKNGMKDALVVAGSDAEKLAACLEDYPQGAGLYRTYYNAKDFETMLKNAKRSPDDISYFKSMLMPNPKGATREQLDFTKDEVKLWSNIVWFVSAEAKAAIESLNDEDQSGRVCKSDRISRSLITHVTDKSANPFANWWSRKNVENQLPMFACPDQRNGAYNSANDCFTSFGKPVDIAAAQPASEGESPFRILSLREMPGTTYYWTRVSPDGRFVGNGSSEDLDINRGGFEAFVDDLATANRRVLIRAKYDPGFTPDNEWFLFQGANGDYAQAAFCRMSSLFSQSKIVPLPPVCLGPTEKDGSHIHLYQSIGADPEGGPYVIAQGGWENDNGGNEANGGITFNVDPLVKQGENKLNLFVFDGASSGLAESITFKNEGDWVVAPSTRLVVGRYGQGSSQQIGYRIHELSVRADNKKSVGYSVNQKVVGEICSVDPNSQRPRFRGGKVQISLDDRFLGTHRYSATEGVALADASSDLLVYDLLTGNSMQVTNMPKGMYALYPSWRSDGWIYFLVRDRRPNGGKDYLAATNAAHWLAQQPGSTAHIVDDNDFEAGQ